MPVCGRLTVLAALAFTLLSGAARADSTMTFVVDPFPPFTYEENGAAAGPMSDTVRAVCEAIKVQCKLEVYPWRRALKLAEDGYVDGIYAIVDIPERRQFFYVTPPIIDSGYAVFVHKSSTLTYHQPSDLAGYTVGAFGPSAASRAVDELARAVPTLRTLIEVDNVTLLKKLSSMRYGERGAAFANVDVGNYLVKQENIADLRVAGVVSKTAYSIGLSRAKVSEQRAQEFMTALRKLVKAGKVRETADKYGVVAPAAN
ncbi:substrate-binding periplasmic protein [Piscinibacter sp.]|jgi:polar amino acid transport system substrate-binding protein|uniref:substrate-binding periplasmic protein n=1 Tax=Piscinibacter sp. TaxID=1903157 RepID=UPI0035599A6F